MNVFLEPMSADFVYPTVEDVYGIHETVVSIDPVASRGVLHEGSVSFALSHVKEGHFGEAPETIHEKAAHLMRLLAANHEFADGNKRTALATTAAFYWENGHYLDYGDEEIRTLLKTFAVIERFVDVDAVATYFEKCAVPRNEINEDDVARAIESIRANVEGRTGDDEPGTSH